MQPTPHPITKSSLSALLVLTSLASTATLQAQSWIATADDFRVPANWNPANLPGSGGTATISNGGTPTLADGPFLDIGRLLIGGDGSGSSNLVGNLIVTGGVTRFSTTFDDHSVVGNVAANFVTIGTSVLTMNGGEIQIDDPEGTLSGKTGLSARFNFDGTGTNTWDTTGLFNKDLFIGSQGRGRLELHGDSKLLLGDDLGLANNGSGAGQEATLIMDGTSLLAVGSGAEIGKLNATVTVSLGGNSIFAAGNSLGPGNAAGQTDEGYVTVGTRDSGTQNINIGDQAELQCITLQNRLGNTQINLTGEGKLKIHDVFSGSGTTLATRPSYLGSGNPCTTTITLRDSSLMLVDCLLGTAGDAGSNGVNGLHVGGGDALQNGTSLDPASYKSSAGGNATLDVGDSAFLDIRQGLHLGFGTAATSNATLRITGPDATVAVGGNLNLAYNEYMGAAQPENGIRPGTGRLEFVLTGNSIKPIMVGGTARIANGTLKLVLDGYVPTLGTRYTLIQAGSVDGEFKEVDLSGAPLSGEQFWEVTNTGTSVTATVTDPSGLGTLLSIETDETSATLTWTSNGQLQVSPDLTTPFVDVVGATSPYQTPRDTTQKFYRLRY